MPKTENDEATRDHHQSNDKAKPKIGFSSNNIPVNHFRFNGNPVRSLFFGHSQYSVCRAW